MFWNYLTIIYICWETSTDMKTHIIALFLLIGGALNLFGENLHNFFNRYNFSFITEDTGLPHNFINDIYKDTQGYGYVADGIFQNWDEVYAHTNENGKLVQSNAQPGDIRFKDLNHDGVLDENDKTWIGNPYPDLMVGLNLGFSYKNIDFTANFYGTFGNDIFNKTKGLYSGVSGQNVWAGTLQKAWHGEGTSNDIPRLSYNDLNQNYTRVSSFFVEDGSYMRCKLLQVGYTLPKKWLNGTELRLSLSAQNPFTITSYSGMDPERPQIGKDGSVIETGIDGIAYPNPRTFLFGIDLRF